MNTGFGGVQVSLRLVIESSDHSVSNHLLVVLTRLWGFLCQAYRTTWLWPPLSGAKRHLGFAIF